MTRGVLPGVPKTTLVSGKTAKSMELMGGSVVWGCWEVFKESYRTVCNVLPGVQRSCLASSKTEDFFQSFIHRYGAQGMGYSLGLLGGLKVV